MASSPWTLHDLDYFSFYPRKIRTLWEGADVLQAFGLRTKADGSSYVVKMGCFATALPNVLYLTQDGTTVAPR